MPTVYDEVAYPSALFDLTHPDRLAVYARLHGLSPAPPATARVLEIGCGEGYNLMGLAAAYPQARLEGFDLAETAIAKGRARAAAAGLDNVFLAVGNVLDAGDAIAPGSFDYIVAHGLYSWVPEPVRDAVMALIAHALAPHGVAYISYNALPGGHFRRAMRDLMLHEIEGIDDPAERLAAARQVLKTIAEDEAPGEITIDCMRKMATAMLEKHEVVLFHDELGEVYAPQSLSDVVAHGARAGLRYLNDSEHVRVYEGFLPEGAEANGDPAEIDRALVRKAQSRDNRNTCFFRTSLFVRGDAPVGRTLDLAALDGLWISTSLHYNAEDDEFQGAKDRRIKFGDEAISAAFNRIVAAYPGRLAMADVLEDERWREVFMKLFSVSYVDLHAGPAPFAMQIGDRPETSPFARFEIAEGSPTLPRLDHKDVRIDQENLRALLFAANGERTVDEIARELDGVFPADEIVPALNAAARIGLMRK